MKTRTLKDGSLVDELTHAVTMKVYTRCPGKYKLVDMQTGEEYVGVIPESNDGYYWKRTDG